MSDETDTELDPEWDGDFVFAVDEEVGADGD